MVATRIDDGGPLPNVTMTAEEERRRKPASDNACFCPAPFESPWRLPINRRERRIAAALGFRKLPVKEPS